MVSTWTTPRSSFEVDSHLSSTVVSPYSVSPWNVGATWRNDSISRLAIALAGDVGDAHAEQDRVDVVADHDVLAELGRLLGVVRVEVGGWWFIVSRQNRWSSYSVTVLPGQCW